MTLQLSIDEVDECAATLWDHIKSDTVFAIHGAMGTGKTTLISALCRHLGVTGNISSPTFSIINEYSYLKDGNDCIIFHIDLYRLDGIEEVLQTGVEDCINSQEICFVEWAEKAPQLFEENAVHIYIQPVSEKIRSVKIVGASGVNNPEQS